MEMPNDRGTVFQPRTRSRSSSPASHLADRDEASRLTDLLDALRSYAQNIPSTQDTASPLDTLLSLLHNSTSTRSPPARQLAYLDGLAALLPETAEGWTEKARQGVAWTKDALEQLVAAVEELRPGTAADSAEGRANASSGTLSARVVSWLEGIADYVGEQVGERKDAKGKGKAVERFCSSCAKPTGQTGDFPVQQASPDFPFGRIGADESPRKKNAASTSKSGSQHNSLSQTLVAGNTASSFGKAPFAGQPSLHVLTGSKVTNDAGDDTRHRISNDPADLLTASGRRVLVYHRVEHCSSPPDWYLLGTSGQRRIVKEEELEGDAGVLGGRNEDEADADGHARMGMQGDGRKDRARHDRAPSPPSERKARRVPSQAEDEDEEDEDGADPAFKAPSPAQKPLIAQKPPHDANAAAAAQDAGDEHGASTTTAPRLASPASQHQRTSSNSSAARSPSHSPTPPPVQQQPKVPRQKPLVKKAQAGLFRPPSGVGEDEEEEATSRKDKKGKAKVVQGAPKKREREERDDEADVQYSGSDADAEESGKAQVKAVGGSNKAVHAQRKKGGAAPARKRPMPTVKKAEVARRSSNRQAASSSKAGTSTSRAAKTANKRVSRSYTTSEDEVDQLASDQEAEVRPPPKKRVRTSSASTTSSQRARRSSTGTTGSPASSPKSGKKVAQARKSTSAPAKSQRPVEKGSRRSARVSSEAPGVKREEEVHVKEGTIGFAVQRSEGSRCWPVWVLRSDANGVVFCPLPGTRPIADAEPVICTLSFQLVSGSPIAPVPDGTPILPPARAKALKLAQELAGDKRELKKWVARVEKVWAEQEVEESD